MQLINSRLRLTLQDGRIMVGQLLAYDKHLNVVLADVEEFRTTRVGEQRRTLGMLVLRGRWIVSLVPEGVPAPNRVRMGVPAPGAPAGMAPGMPMPGAPGMM